MRILTGKDREEYETLLTHCADAEARVQLLQLELTARRAMYREIQDELTHERQRADNAVDALLAMRGIPPISPQLDVPPVSFENPLAEDPAEVEHIEADMKRLGIGAVFAQEAKG